MAKEENNNPFSRKRIIYIIINFIACFFCYFDFGLFIRTTKHAFALVMLFLGILNSLAVFEWVIEAFFYVRKERKQKQ